jgi:hypothetical protein
MAEELEDFIGVGRAQRIQHHGVGEREPVLEVEEAFDAEMDDQRGIDCDSAT